MAEAAARDQIARQYTTAFADVFEFGVPRLRETLALWDDVPWAMASVYLGFLARHADTHVVRKLGNSVADDVRRKALPYDKILLAAQAPRTQEPVLLQFDAELKSAGINPGSSADLSVASMFALRLMAISAE